MTDQPLTQEEIGKLKDGDLVSIIWSGGNGPHVYQIAKSRFGHPFAAPTDRPLDCIPDAEKFHNPIEFVGADHYHTRVWRALPEN